METVTVLVDDAQIIIFKCRSKHNSNKKNTGPLRLRYYIKVQTGNLEIPQPLYSESSQLGTDERNGVFLFLSSISYQLEEVQILP